MLTGLSVIALEIFQVSALLGKKLVELQLSIGAITW